METIGWTILDFSSIEILRQIGPWNFLLFTFIHNQIIFTKNKSFYVLWSKKILFSSIILKDFLTKVHYRAVCFFLKYKKILISNISSDIVIRFSRMCINCFCFHFPNIFWIISSQSILSTLTGGHWDSTNSQVVAPNTFRTHWCDYNNIQTMTQHQENCCSSHILDIKDRSKKIQGPSPGHRWWLEMTQSRWWWWWSQWTLCSETPNWWSWDWPVPGDPCRPSTDCWLSSQVTHTQTDGRTHWLLHCGKNKPEIKTVGGRRVFIRIFDLSYFMKTKKESIFRWKSKLLQCIQYYRVSQKKIGFKKTSWNCFSWLQNVCLIC